MNTNNQLCVKLLHCGNRNISNLDDRSTKSLFYMPMGLFPMAANLKEDGVDVEIIHSDLEDSPDIEEALDFEILDAVGLDCHWINQSLAVMQTANLIKKIKPGVFIFLGGFSASFFASEILADYPEVDAVVRGDGEVPIVELCRVLKEITVNNNSNRTNRLSRLAAVPNLAWKEKNGKVILNEFSYVASRQDMDQLDFAPLDLLRNWESYRELCRYWSEFPTINESPMFFLEVGRGCGYNCSFCGGNLRAQFCMNNRKKHSIRSVDSVISTIKKAIGFGYTFFYICFEFEGSDEWFMELFRKIKEEPLEISLGYGCWGIPSKRLIHAISESCQQAVIEISPETADLNLRRKNKDLRLFYTNEQLEECLEYIGTKDNLKAQLYFGYFLPFETEDTVFAAIDYITELLIKYSHFTEVLYMNLSTDPASLVFFSPDEYEVDLEVHNFGDFLLKLEEIYVIKKQTPRWLTLAKPRDMTYAQTNDLAKKIEFFGNIFLFFPRSGPLILKRINQPGILSRRLRKIDFTKRANHDRPVEEIKNLLKKICNELNITDSEIIDLIDSEFKQAAVRYIESNPMNNDDCISVEIITEDEKNRVSSDIQKARESIRVDFDI